MKRGVLALVLMVLVACGNTTTTMPTTKVRVGLDWVPNPNHTGLYVAAAQGLYTAQGLAVEILQAQEGGSVEQLVATGRLDFGISYQETVTQARAEGVPIVSVAAVIQHNDSGFASRATANIRTPKDWEGKRYGAYGSPVEQAVIKGLMDCTGADFSKVAFVNLGSTNFLAATARGDVDFAWIFRGVDGVAAEQQNIPLNIIMLNDIPCVPDYYTPVLITSEKLIATQPDVVRRFVTATSQGYTAVKTNPDQAASLLLQAVPELDAATTKASVAYLAGRYQDDAPRWGEQRSAIWQRYAQWMFDRQLLPKMIAPEQAFTNEFLP